MHYQVRHALAPEELRCNVCEQALSPDAVAIHSASDTHKNRKAQLERDLGRISAEKYENDTSVILTWKESA